MVRGTATTVGMLGLVLLTGSPSTAQDGGRTAAPRWLIVFAGVIAVVVTALNIKLLFGFPFSRRHVGQSRR